MRQAEIGAVITTHVWDGGNIVADIEGSSITTYLRGVNLIASFKSGVKKYYLYNAHGDVVLFGSKTYKYDAFGNELAPNVNDVNPFRYAGEYYDSETKCYYLRARYYEPSIGRFSSEDPIKNGLNWYTYCASNPIFFIDPTGLVAVELRGWFDEKYSYIKESYKDVSAALNWNEATRTAYVHMMANGYSGYAEFTVGQNGTYIDPKTNRMYVDLGLLWAIFGKVIDPPLEHDYVGDAIMFVGGLFIAGAFEFGGGVAAVGEAVKAGAAKITGIGAAGLTVPEFVKSAGGFISWTREAFEKTHQVLNLNQVKQLFNMANQYGVNITADLAGHAGTAWEGAHIHIGDARIHIAVAGDAIKWIIEHLK